MNERRRGRAWIRKKKGVEEDREGEGRRDNAERRKIERKRCGNSKKNRSG